MGDKDGGGFLELSQDGQRTVMMPLVMGYQSRRREPSYRRNGLRNITRSRRVPGCTLDRPMNPTMLPIVAFVFLESTY
jgi:hypothetical protein